MAKETSPMEIDRENQLAMVTVDQPAKAEEPRFYEGMMFGLPREWTVELRPRKATSKYRGKVDQFFYEPGTRRQFRSLKAVKKHLGLDEGQSSNNRRSEASKATDQSKNPNADEKVESKATGQFKNANKKIKVSPRNKVADKENGQENCHYFNKIARRVKWQLVDAEQDSWDLYVQVPKSVREGWKDVFLKPNIG